MYINWNIGDRWHLPRVAPKIRHCTEFLFNDERETVRQAFVRVLLLNNERRTRRMHLKFAKERDIGGHRHREIEQEPRFIRLRRRHQERNGVVRKPPFHRPRYTLARIGSNVIRHAEDLKGPRLGRSRRSWRRRVIVCKFNRRKPRSCTCGQPFH